jgi:predicted nucleotidyltransferase
MARWSSLGAASLWDSVAASLGEILDVLVRALGPQRSFAVVGATARNAWAPPRATTDVDLAVAAEPSVLEAAERALTTAGYSCTRRHRADAEDPLPDLLVFRSGKGVLRQVDFLVAKTAFEREVLRRAVPVEIGGAPVPVASLEDLVVYKLIADRSRDRDDIEAMLRTQSRAGARIDWDYVERWGRFWGISERVAALRARLRDG